MATQEELSNDLKARVHRKVEERLRREQDQKHEKERLRKAAAERKAEYDKIAKLAEEKVKETKAAQDQERRKSSPWVNGGRGRAPPRQTKKSASEKAQEMKYHTAAYLDQLASMQDRIDRRKPLYGIDGNLVRRKAAQRALSEKRQEERRKQRIKEERQRWEALQEVQKRASERPLLLEDNMPAKSESAPALVTHTMLAVAGQTEYESDARIKAAISKKSFSNSDWGKQVRRIKENVCRRQKPHEVDCPPLKEGNTFELSRTILCNSML